MTRRQALQNGEIAAPANEKIAPSCRGKKNISGYFAPEVHRQLRVIADEEDKKLQDVLGDALNAYLSKRANLQLRKMDNDFTNEKRIKTV